jgi:hypothetical protein
MKLALEDAESEGVNSVLKRCGKECKRPRVKAIVAG